MSDRDGLVAAMNSNYDSVWELYSSLSDEEFAEQSLCPDWTARGVLTHLAGVEAMMSGWFPDAGGTPIPFELVGDYITSVATVSNAELLESYRSITHARRDELAALSSDDFSRPSMTPVGPGTYGRFIAIRCFDFWVHERDVRMPLARPRSDDGPTAELALDEVHRSLGYIVGKKVGLPDQMSLTFHLDGPLTKDLHVRVDGRASVVDHLENPDVEVTANSTSFIMLACGRLDPQDEIDAGRISWTGDPGSPAADIGERAARNLAFTM